MPIVIAMLVATNKTSPRALFVRPVVTVRVALHALPVLRIAGLHLARDLGAIAYAERRRVSMGLWPTQVLCAIRYPPQCNAREENANVPSDGIQCITLQRMD